ncbi:MAG: peptidoglycan-binding protein [Sulfuricella sp.]|nr:peptidoglycan-binding protein [Sulfuricella sp.]
MSDLNVKSLLLMRGSRGAAVSALKQALRTALGEEAANDAGLAAGDEFDAATEASLRTWQARVGLTADGIAGPCCQAGLGVLALPALGLALDASEVKGFFPGTRYSAIAANLPYVTAALRAFGLDDPAMVAVALGTIRAETAAFVPIAERPSHFNTLPGQPAFSAYEPIPGNRLAKTLGNDMPGDGARFCGRGYVQLTGRGNYRELGEMLGIPLMENPDSACAPEVAACLLAAFLYDNRGKLDAALAKDDLKAVRKVVNGGSHGLDEFRDTFTRTRDSLRHPKAALAGAVGGGAPSAPHPATLDVSPDPADLRDRPYTPPPHSLLKQYPPDNLIAQYMGAYSAAGLILNQGQEGACTGFGLACVVNYLRWRVNGMPKQLESASPRMLYHFAKLYDEFEGEDYEGSSCRGALKGWFHNGVCLESQWPYAPGRDTRPLTGWDSEAAERTLGVYCRIDTRSITDLQAAIQEVGAIYVSAYTHEGWRLQESEAPAAHLDLPRIDWNGLPSRTGGHAFALVGFNRDGFVIQNSWGKEWGAGGFAVIGYADWLAHAMDAWVAGMGVPGVVSGRLATGGGAKGGQAGFGDNPEWWDEDTAYRHSIVLGNNGHVTRFDKLDAVNRNLLNQACVLPNDWFRKNAGEKKRLVIYAHGGLNSESAAIERARAMGRYFLGNGCYPLFLVWKSGLLEAFGDILHDKVQPDDARAGLAGWSPTDLTDPLIETTIGRPLARPLWSEMKENAELASQSGRGGDLLTDAIRSLASTWGEQFELYLVGHSAGSIIHGRLLDNLARKGMTGLVKSVHLYAPACTVDFANRYYAPLEGVMKNLYLDILSDGNELDDNVAGIYRKSLLYFISNALEADSGTPILGLANVYDSSFTDWDGSPNTSEALVNWRAAFDKYKFGKRLNLHAKEKIVVRRAGVAGNRDKTANASHGGFDNDVEMVGKTLELITGGPLVKPVLDLAGF